MHKAIVKHKKNRDKQRIVVLTAGKPIKSDTRLAPKQIVTLTTPTPQSQQKQLVPQPDPLKKPLPPDLFPWPFATTFKAVLRHREWNKLVASIQNAAVREMEAENKELHVTVKTLLDERDNLRDRCAEVIADVKKFTHGFDSKYGG